MSRLRVVWMPNLPRSVAIHLRPSFSATAAVVPLPQKKSATRSPSLLLAEMMRSSIASGLGEFGLGGFFLPGFVDVLEIGRGERRALYDLALRHMPPLVPRAWRLEIAGRRAADGSELEPIPAAALAALLEQLQAQGRVRLVAGLPSGVRTGATGLSHLLVTEASGESSALPCDLLLVRQGLSPKLGALAHWGLALEKKLLPVDTTTFATSVAGVHAVGDIVGYPGKKRLIVCGFHEAVMCAYALQERLTPESVGPLQYTTTSALLQARLGVRDTKLAEISQPSKNGEK